MAFDITDSMIDTYPEEYREDLKWAQNHRVRLNFYDYIDFCKAKRFIENRRFGSFLELGVLYGGSVLLFSRFIKPGGRVVGVDNMSSFSNIKQESINNIIADRITPLFNRIAEIRYLCPRFVQKNSIDWMLQSNETFDLIHVDTNHDIDSFVRDLIVAYGKLSKGGLLLLDDCNVQINGVVRGSAIGWRLIRDRVGLDIKDENDRYGCVPKTDENDRFLLPLLDHFKDWPLGK